VKQAYWWPRMVIIVLTMLGTAAAVGFLLFLLVD
jgi:hypothetical protein